MRFCESTDEDISCAGVGGLGVYVQNFRSVTVEAGGRMLQGAERLGSMLAVGSDADRQSMSVISSVRKSRDRSI